MIVILRRPLGHLRQREDKPRPFQLRPYSGGSIANLKNGCPVESRPDLKASQQHEDKKKADDR